MPRSLSRLATKRLDVGVVVSKPVLGEEQSALLDQGARVLWRPERSTVCKALARHLQDGTTKFAKGIPTEGIESVSLSLATAFWMTKVVVLFVIAFPMLLLGPSGGPLHEIGVGMFALCFPLTALGVTRLTAALRSRNRFRRAHQHAVGP